MKNSLARGGSQETRIRLHSWELRIQHHLVRAVMGEKMHHNRLLRKLEELEARARELDLLITAMRTYLNDDTTTSAVERFMVEIEKAAVVPNDTKCRNTLVEFRTSRDRHSCIRVPPMRNRTRRRGNTSRTGQSK